MAENFDQMEKVGTLQKDTILPQFPSYLSRDASCDSMWLHMQTMHG
jgi:hypothetical protein